MRNMLLFLLTICLLAGTLQAEPVELVYDSGHRAGVFNQTNRGDIEGVRFTPEHPCSLLSFRFRVSGTGMMEWHVWADNGGNMPDIEVDLVEPIEVDVENDNSWITVEFEEILTFDVPRHFHIGYVKQADSPRLYVDGGNPVGNRSVLRIGGTWYVTGDGSGNYLLRATVEYYDELDEDDFLFSNISEDAGIGGMSKMAWGDYDNDGWEDLLVNGRILYRNLTDGTFENVSEDAGIVQDNQAHGGTWGDFNNDGWLDFLAFNSSHNALDRLYENNGDGTFRLVNREYFFEHGDNPTAGCGWGDANNDGFLELYIANSEDWNDGNPVYYRDYFYAYDPDFDMFWDITPNDIARNRYYGRGVAWCDFDFDGDMDLYISNYRLQPNYLLVNEGVDNDGMPQFENQAAERGVIGVRQQGSYGHTIGSAWGDYDNDGDFDLFAANLAHPRFIAFSDKCMLYRCDSEDYTFEDVREDAGITYDETASCPAWGDYDNDGWLDIFITSVYRGRQPYIYHNEGDGTFTNVNYPTGFHMTCDNTWGVTWCDYDHDGDLDIAIGGGGGLFENRSDDDQNYFQLTLQGTGDNNHFAFGSQASVYAGDLHQLRQVEGGSGAEGVQNMMTLHYGLGDAEVIDSVVVVWLGGETERYYDIDVNQRLTAVEGEGLMTAPRRPRTVDIPMEFTLAVPYPNPFNSRLTVEFTLQHSDDVKFVIYDSRGRRVLELADREFSAGTQRLVWDAGDFPSGNYIIQATHSNGVAVRTVTLMK